MQTFNVFQTLGCHWLAYQTQELICMQLTKALQSFFSLQVGASREFRPILPVTSPQAWLHLHNGCFPKKHKRASQEKASCVVSATHTAVIDCCSNKQLTCIIRQQLNVQESINTVLTGTYFTNCADSRWHTDLTVNRCPAQVLMGRWKAQQGALI